MAEITNRQVLINLHTATGDTSALLEKGIELGEIAIKHNNPTDATIYTKVGENGSYEIAKFITDLAVDAKISNFKTNVLDANADKEGGFVTFDNYDDRVSQVEDNIDDINELLGNTSGSTGESLTSRLQQAEQDIDALEGTIGYVKGESDRTVLEMIGTVPDNNNVVNMIGAVQRGLNSATTDITTLKSNVETNASNIEKLDTTIGNVESGKTVVDMIADAKAAANLAITEAVEALDSEVSSDEIDIESETSKVHVKVQVTQVDGKLTEVTLTESGIADKTETEQSITNLRSELVGTSSDTSADTTIYGALNVAVEAKGKIDAFLLDANLTESAVDTLKEIQTYITTDGEAAAQLVTRVKDAEDDIAELTTSVETNAAGIQTLNTTIGNVESGKTVVGMIADAKAAITSAINDLDAEVGKTTVDENEFVAVQVTQVDGKLTDVTVATSDIASATALSTLQSAAVKDAEIVGVGVGQASTIPATKNENKLTFDFSNLVIDCGTF